MKPSERRHLRTRQTILEAALALIVEKGPDDLSLREVARRVDYSPAAIYEYFGGKDDLVATLCSDGMKRLAATLREATADAPLREYLTELGLGYLRFAQDHSAHYRLMFNYLLSTRRSLAEPGDEEDAYRILLTAVEAGINAGAFELTGDDHADHLSYAFWALLHGLAMLRLTKLKDFDADFETADRRAIEIFLRGLLE